MFIELTYFKRDKAYPGQSRSTDKKFWLNIDKIEELTGYGYDDRNVNSHTKITMIGGRTIDVSEEVTFILDAINMVMKRKTS